MASSVKHATTIPKTICGFEPESTQKIRFWLSARRSDYAYFSKACYAISNHVVTFLTTKATRSFVFKTPTDRDEYWNWDDKFSVFSY